MLLIVGGETDQNTMRIVDQAAIRGVEYLFWNTDDEGADQVAWCYEDDLLRLGNESFKPTAIFNRANVFGGDSALNNSIHAIVAGYVSAKTGVKLLNHRSMNYINSKAANLKLAIDLGFEIPKTMAMINTTPLQTHPNPESTIVKPFMGGDYTLTVSEFLMTDPDKLGMKDSQFIQDLLPGENLRVFCIGGATFAFHLVSDALDYRVDKKTQIKTIELEPGFLSKCKAMADQIGFDYCALDFRCKNQFDEPVFLEINSFPMFVGFDNVCENKLADAILDFLV